RTLDVIESDPQLADKVRAVPAQPKTNPASPVSHSPAPGKRAPKGTITRERFFIPYILAVLKNAKGHAMHCRDVLKELEAMIPRGKFPPLDLVMLSSGVVRWKNKAQWARNIMVEDGLIEPVETAGHGVWKLTDAGLAQARKA